MNYNLITVLLLLIQGISIFSFGKEIKPSNTQGRQKINFDKTWKFKLGEVEQASAIMLDDSEWRVLDVPHDWSIEGNYDSLHEAGVAGAFLPTGLGWYRKSFDVPKEWLNKNVFIQFDGVYNHSTVYINGHELGYRPNGYIGFSYNLRGFLKEKENVIAVKVDHRDAPSGRWYTGSGIYRHVNLVVTNDVYVPEDGLFITTPKITKENTEVNIDLEIQNNLKASEVEVKFTVMNKEGKEVIHKLLTVETPNTFHKINESIQLTNPSFWSTSTPYLYTLKVELKAGGKLQDVYTSTFGIREITLSVEEGLKVNGEETLIQGVCLHQDAGPVGVAVPEDVLYRRLRKLKEMGCNAIRTAHHPFAPEFYAMCDSMGFLVMDEAFDGWEAEKATFDYGLQFEEWWQIDLEAFLRKDRNHPSIIFWSIGNEVKKYTDATQKKLVDFVKKIDNTRLISQGRGYRGPYIDIAGFNGHGEYKGAIEKFHKSHPNTPVIGTEITHNYQTRGIYRTKTWYRLRDFPAPWETKDGKWSEDSFSKIEHKIHLVPDLTEEEVFEGIDPIYQSSYDNSLVRMNIRDSWKQTLKHKYFIGAYRWTGFDYLGESFGWPARTSSFGIMDLAGFETDNYYLYQSLWSEKPMVHLLPHWSHKGKEGVEIPVVVYTNLGEAELFLNGKSLGKKKMGEDLQMVWKVPYEKGELKVKAITKEGQVIEKAYSSCSEAYTTKVEFDKTVLTSSNQEAIHAVISVVDKEGNEVPNASNLFEFELEGPAKIIGVENGDILDLSSNKIASRKAFNGKALVLLQANSEKGKVTFRVKSKGLKTVKKTFHVISKNTI